MHVNVGALRREVSYAAESAAVGVHYAKEFVQKNPSESNQKALDEARNTERIILDAIEILSDLPGWDNEE